MESAFKIDGRITQGEVTELSSLTKILANEYLSAKRFGFPKEEQAKITGMLGGINSRLASLAVDLLIASPKTALGSVGRLGNNDMKETLLTLTSVSRDLVKRGVAAKDAKKTSSRAGKLISLGKKIVLRKK